MMNIVNKGEDRFRVTFDDVRRTKELNYLFVSPLIIGYVHPVFKREGLYDNDGLIICSPTDERIPIVNGWDTENNECIDDRNHESFQQWVKDNPDEVASLDIKPAPHPKDRKRKI